MEILATYENYSLGITMGALFILIAIIGAIIGVSKNGSLLIGAIVTILAIGGIFLVVNDPSITYYNAIVTDWNEVYEQGYEVVEQNGKTVTLRKVGE